MTAPIDHSVAELLHHLARAKQSADGVSGHVNVAMTRPDLLEVVAHTDKLGLTEHLGIGLDWPYMRLTPKGTEAVSEAIAARRGNRNAQIVIGAMVTIATCAIGAITQVQVARLGAHSAEKAEVKAESTAAESAKAIEARVTTKLDELRTEMERQRRVRVQPMVRDPDVVTSASSQAARHERVIRSDE